MITKNEATESVVNILRKSFTIDSDKCKFIWTGLKLAQGNDDAAGQLLLQRGVSKRELLANVQIDSGAVFVPVL